MHNAHYRHYGSGGKYTTFLVVERERDCARVGPALLVPGKSIITVWLDSFELACIVLTEL